MIFIKEMDMVIIYILSFSNLELSHKPSIPTFWGMAEWFLSNL